MLSRRPHALKLLPRRSHGPKAFERLCTLSVATHGLLALWIYFLVPRSMEDPDIWWHLRNAALQWQARSWLHRDLYSFTAAGAPWINHEWLAEVPFYLGWRAAGSTGLYLVTLLTIEFILLGGYELTRRQSKGPIAASLIAAALACVLATVSFGPRMLLFGWACLVIELLVLQRFYSRFAASALHSDSPSPSDPWIFLLPVLFAFWINLHGSWLIGLVLLAVFIAAGCLRVETGSIHNLAWTRSQWRDLSLVLLLSVGALFVNPYGWHLVLYPFDMAFHQPLNIASAEEWKPLDFQTARGGFFLLSLGALFLAQVVVPVTRRLTWTLWDLAFVAIGIYASCRHARFLFLGAILVMPLLGKHLAHCVSRASAPQKLDSFDCTPVRRRPWLNAALLLATLLIAVLGTFKGTQSRHPPEPQFPVDALPFLGHFHPQGQVFNEYLWGGYLAYNVPRTSRSSSIRAWTFSSATARCAITWTSST
jgi:hypothetical protein